MTTPKDTSSPARDIDGFPLLRKVNLLGICGCGSLAEVLGLVCRFVEATDRTHGDDYSMRQKKLAGILATDAEHLVVEWMLHVLDERGLVEHGFSIGGAWPSARGAQLVAAWKKLGPIQLQMALEAAEDEVLNP